MSGVVSIATGLSFSLVIASGRNPNSGARTVLRIRLVYIVGDVVRAWGPEHRAAAVAGTARGKQKVANQRPKSREGAARGPNRRRGSRGLISGASDPEIAPADRTVRSSTAIAYQAKYVGVYGLWLRTRTSQDHLPYVEIGRTIFYSKKEGISPQPGCPGKTAISITGMTFL